MRYGCVTISCAVASHTYIQGETPLAALNKIQKVAYTLNPFITMVAPALMERDMSVGKFIPIVDYPLPVKPVDIDTNKEARQVTNATVLKSITRRQMFIVGHVGPG